MGEWGGGKRGVEEIGEERRKWNGTGAMRRGRGVGKGVKRGKCKRERERDRGRRQARGRKGNERMREDRETGIEVGKGKG